MSRWRIVSAAGVDLGTWEGDSQAEALDAMATAAGYLDAADAARVAGPFDGTVTEAGPGLSAAIGATFAARPGWTVDPLFQCFARGRLIRAFDGTGPSPERTIRALEEALEALPAEGRDYEERFPVLRAAYRAALARSEAR